MTPEEYEFINSNWNIIVFVVLVAVGSIVMILFVTVKEGPGFILSLLKGNTGDENPLPKPNDQTWVWTEKEFHDWSALPENRHTDPDYYYQHVVGTRIAPQDVERVFYYTDRC